MKTYGKCIQINQRVDVCIDNGQYYYDGDDDDDEKRGKSAYKQYSQLGFQTEMRNCRRRKSGWVFRLKVGTAQRWATDRGRQSNGTSRSVSEVSFLTLTKQLATLPGCNQ